MKVSSLWIIVFLCCALQSLYAQRSSTFSFSQTIDVQVYQGKKFRFDGVVKIIPRHRQTYAGLFARVEKKDGKRIFSDFMIDRPIKSGTWARYMIDGIIGKDAAQLVIGGRGHLGGIFYYDDFRLEIELTPGVWQKIPIQNAGFEQWSPDQKLIAWRGPIDYLANYFNKPSKEQAYEGQYALSIESDGYTHKVQHPIREKIASAKFEHITREQGLPGSEVDVLLQDQYGFVWIGTLNGLVRYDGYSFVLYQNDPTDSLSLSDNLISAIYEDRDGHLWIGTNSGGLNRFDHSSGQFERFLHNPEDSLSLSHNYVTTIYEDRKGHFWVGTRGGGLNRLDRSTKKFKRYTYDANSPFSVQNNIVTVIYEDSSGRLWIGAYRVGIAYFDIEKEKFNHFYSIDDNNYYGTRYIKAIEEDSEGKLWFASDDGLYRFDPDQKKFMDRYIQSPSAIPLHDRNFFGAMVKAKNANAFWLKWKGGISYFDVTNQEFQIFEYSKDNAQGLSSSSTIDLMMDKEGILWIATGNGINRLNPFTNTFYDPDVPIIENSVSSIFEGQKGILWLAGEKGLHQVNLNTKQVVLYQHDPKNSYSISTDIVIEIYEDRRGEIWLSLPEKGIERFNPKTSNFEHIGTKDKNDIRYVFSILEDYLGIMWLATWGGAYNFDRRTQTFQLIPQQASDGKQYGSNDVRAIFEDRSGHLWLGMNNGLLKKYDRSTKLWQVYNPNPDEQLVTYGKNYICQIFEAKDGILWIATSGNGITSFDPHNETFAHFTKMDGLVGNTVFNVLEDASGHLWIVTTEGLSKFNPHTKQFRNYGKNDGLPSNELLCGLHARNGKFYIGSSKGLFAFHPDSIRDNAIKPPIVITSLARYNKNESDQLIPVTGIETKEFIKLSYKDDLLYLEFAALSYSKTANNQYAYKLEGLHDDWIGLGSKRDLTFTNLPPGNYTLHIKGSNGDGIWNETGTALKIRITPPWYWAWWSQSMYALVLIGAIFAFYRIQLNRRLAQAETRRLRELDQVKTSLYTNITHEFRTPLTIILGMIDKVEQAPRQWLAEGAQMIRRNGQSLLRLVNQMLDLSRLEAGSLPVNMVQGDIVAYLRTLLELFRSYADSKNIHLEFASDYEQFVMDHDPDKLKDIISNLLSNALKFTPAGGLIKLEVGSRKLEGTEYLHIIVQDTGVGIPPEKLPHVFGRFYQADDSATRKGEGTGIGLALTKELVKLLGGTIEVESEVGKGSVFIVSLPVTHMALLLESTPFIESEVLEKSDISRVMPLSTSAEAPLALIVEDNADVVSYLSSCLENQYRIEVAYNGQEGINKAIELVPDIIISDVMMPEKDGFELCRTLKDDIRTSHIPIILLTARADMDSRLEGLEGGADAYLTKPFNEQELEVSLRKSLELRQRLRERYAPGGELNKNITTPYYKDDTFIINLHKLLEREYTNEAFAIPMMAKGMEISETQLRRKVRALLDTTPQLYLRQFRLKKAYHLLKYTDLSVKEVAFTTGFDDPAYFSNVFLEEFDRRPSDVR